MNINNSIEDKGALRTINTCTVSCPRIIFMSRSPYYDIVVMYLQHYMHALLNSIFWILFLFSGLVDDLFITDISYVDKLLFFSYFWTGQINSVCAFITTAILVNLIWHWPQYSAYMALMHFTGPSVYLVQPSILLNRDFF